MQKQIRNIDSAENKISATTTEFVTEICYQISM